MQKTELEDGLISNGELPSGNESYRITATPGYNEYELIKNIEVFQGDIDFSE